MALRPSDDQRRPGVVHLTACCRPLWDPASGRFDPVELRAAIVARGWTVSEFAATAQVSRACMYNALRGQAVSDRTVVRVSRLLDTRTSLGVLSRAESSGQGTCAERPLSP
jgi:hypothetical protein